MLQLHPAVKLLFGVIRWVRARPIGGALAVIGGVLLALFLFSLAM